METQYQEQPHSVEGGEHHEKKPMMKKMKDRMKKIKNTLNEKAHGHQAGDEHEHEHDNDLMSEEEDGHEEGREAAPEVHGAPMYESEAARHSAGAGAGAGGRDENLGPGKVTFGEAKDPSGPKENKFGTTAASDESRQLNPSTATGTAAGERPNSIRDRDENTDPQKVDSSAKAGSVEEDLSAPKAKTGTPAAATQLSHPSNPSPKGNTENTDLQKVASRATAGSVDEDLSAPKAKTGTPADKPRGGDEVGESPLVSSFQAMAFSDKPKGAEGVLESPPAGTHDQFSPDKPQQDTPREGTEEQKSSSYTDKISSTATAAKGVAVSAAIGSAGYSKKIASTVYDKVSEAGTTILGKGTTQEEKNGDIKTEQPGKPKKGVSEKGASVKEYVVKTLRPGDEDRALSEVMSDAMHTNKQEAAGATPVGAKGSSEESGSGKGMVEKIKGAVTSWIGAGSTAGAAQGSPTKTTTTETDITGKEAETGQ